MALLTQTLVKARLEVEFATTDSNGDATERRKYYELELHGADDDTKRANAVDDVASFLTDLAAVTEVDITGHAVSFVSDTTDAVTSTNKSIYREAVCTLIPDALGKDDISHTIIAPAPTIVANKALDNDVAALQAYFDNFEPAATGYFRMSNGQAITAAASQLRRSRIKTVSSGKIYG